MYQSELERSDIPTTAFDISRFNGVIFRYVDRVLESAENSRVIGWIFEIDGNRQFIPSERHLSFLPTPPDVEQRIAADPQYGYVVFYRTAGDSRWFTEDEWNTRMAAQFSHKWAEMKPEIAVGAYVATRVITLTVEGPVESEAVYRCVYSDIYGGLELELVEDGLDPEVEVIRPWLDPHIEIKLPCSDPMIVLPDGPSLDDLPESCLRLIGLPVLVKGATPQE